MNWFSGEISQAIQKAIQEKKVFLVFIEATDENDVEKMTAIWQDGEVSQVCAPDKCICISIVADSVAGQQFSSIYPILSIPSTYLIDSQGIPVDIIPGVHEKNVFVQRLNNGINDILNRSKAPTTVEIPTAEIPMDDSTIDNHAESTTDVLNTDELSTSSGSADSNDQALSNKEKAEKLLEKARAIKAQKEKQAAKEMEIKRIEENRQLSMARRDLAERQAKKLADEIAKQKAEEKAAKEKVREQIRKDRAEKNAKRDAEKRAKEEIIKKKVEEKNLATEAKKTINSNISRLQFRLPDGSSITNTFPADSAFSSVQQFAQELIKDSYPSIRLTTAYPRREFTAEHSSSSLRDLNLIPAACIIISPGRAQSVTSKSSLSPYNLIMFILSPIFAIFNYIMTLFGGNSQSNSSSNTDQPQQTDTQSEQNSASRAAATRRRLGGNINRLRHDDDDENATWNGNSTQQM